MRRALDKNICIGCAIQIGSVVGRVTGIERLADESIVGVIIETYQAQHPSHLVYIRLDEYPTGYVEGLIVNIPSHDEIVFN